MSEKLLPCPFCGGTSISAQEGSTFRWWVASCNECGASAGEVRRQTLPIGDDNRTNAELNKSWDAKAAADALKEWNTRAQQPSAAQSGWMPIESAPKSAERLLVFNQGGRVAIETGHYVHNMMHAALIDQEECHFTHWQHLPPPPSLEQFKKESNG